MMSISVYHGLNSGMSRSSPAATASAMSRSIAQSRFWGYSQCAGQSPRPTGIRARISKRP